MSKHNYTNPAFCQNSEFYPIPSATNKENIESIYNRSLQVNFNTSSSSHYDAREGPLRMQRSMSTRSVAVKRNLNECTHASSYQQQRQQLQPRRSTASQNSNSFETRCGSGRFALVPVEDLTPTHNKRYAIVPGSTLSSNVLQNSRRYARSQDDLDRYSSQNQLDREEEPHSFHEDPAGTTYTSLPPILDHHQLPPKRKVALPNRQNSTHHQQHQQQQQQQTKIKHAFSSDFGSKTFLIVDKNSNQRYQMVPTAEDEELVDDNHEIIQMHNGKAHRYAMIPAEDNEDFEFQDKQHQEEETCLSNTDLNRSENFLPRGYEQANRSSMRTSTPQKGTSLSNLHSYPNTPLKNPQATKMLHELLSTPPRKTPIKTPHRPSQYTTPRQMYASQRDLRPQYTPQQQSHHYVQNDVQQSAPSPPPPPPPPLLPRKNSQLSPQRLHYETVKPVTDRTMAVIQPRLAGSRIHPQLQEEDEEEEDEEETNCNSGQKKSRITPTYPEKIANATITLAIVSLMLVLGSSMNSALIVYMIAHMGKSFYLQFSLVAAISGVGLGFLGFRSRHCEWLPNRSYTSGYILVTMFCLLKCCGLLVILVFDPYPGLPLHDVTTGIILGLSTFTMFFIGLGVIGTLWCYRPPPDNRVDVV